MVLIVCVPSKHLELIKLLLLMLCVNKYYVPCRQNFFQEGDHVYPKLDLLEAYKKGLNTWASWINTSIDANRTLVFFRGYSVEHYSGGLWNSGGQCHRETEPIFNDTQLQEYPSKMRVVESVISKIKIPVIFMNISKLTNYRKDGHPSIYTMEHKTGEERKSAVKIQDCNHWCMPGVPDTWNELLYVSLLRYGKGPWKN